MVGLMEKKTQLPDFPGTWAAYSLCACADPQKLTGKKSRELKKSVPESVFRVED